MLLTEDQLQPKVIDTLTLWGEEDTPVLIEGISCSDVDVAVDALVRITLMAEHGTVTVKHFDDIVNASLANESGSIGLFFEEGKADGRGSAHVSFLSSMSTANEALSIVTFHPDPNYFGYAATVNVTVNDLGNLGIGGAKEDTQSFRIYIQPRNDPPHIITSIDSGASPIFLLDELEYIRIDGAIYKSIDESTDNAETEGSRIGGVKSWESGYELWRLEEPTKASISAGRENQVNNLPSHGAGGLSWDTRQVADIQAGPGHSNPRFFTEYNNMLYFQADDGVHGKEMWRTGNALQVGWVCLARSSLEIKIRLYLYISISLYLYIVGISFSVECCIGKSIPISFYHTL